MAIITGCIHDGPPREKNSERRGKHSSPSALTEQTRFFYLEICPLDSSRTNKGVGLNSWYVQLKCNPDDDLLSILIPWLIPGPASRLVHFVATIHKRPVNRLHFCLFSYDTTVYDAMWGFWVLSLWSLNQTFYSLWAMLLGEWMMILNYLIYSAESLCETMKDNRWDKPEHQCGWWYHDSAPHPAGGSLSISEMEVTSATSV